VPVQSGPTATRRSEMKGLDRTGPDRTGLDRVGLDRAGLDRVGLGWPWTEPDLLLTGKAIAGGEAIRFRG
jgi:hypothetical protein